MTAFAPPRQALLSRVSLQLLLCPARRGARKPQGLGIAAG